jgi:Skp family chaperone for outer membrane proteins
MHRPNLIAIAAGAAIAGAAFLAGNAEARRPVVLAAAPTAVGVVNMATVFDRLNEAAEWDVKLKNLEARFVEEGRARSAALEAMDKEIKAMSEGEAKERKLDEFRLKRLQAEAWNGMKELELDRERSLKWQAVYRAVREGCARLCENEKLDLVMVDDSKIEITAQRSKDAPPLETQVKAQITQLRVLHSTRTVDVTEKLIVQINNSRPKAG